MVLLETDRHYKVAEVPECQLGPIFGLCPPVVVGSDMDSLLACFGKRMNHVTDATPTPEFVRHSQSLMREVCVNFAPFEYCHEVFSSWHVKQSPTKQASMLEAFSRVQDASLSLLATKELMVKAEVLLKWNDPTWAPRAIAVGSPEYNVITGPVQDTLNKRLALALDEHSGPIRFCMAYAKDDLQLAEFINCDAPVFVEGDFSANDRDQIRYAMELTRDWSHRLGAPQWYCDLLTSLNTKMYINRDYGLWAQVRNMLDSGATNGTFRNTIWNASLFHHACMTMRVPRARALVLGDDIGAAVWGSFKTTTWQELCASNGMRLKAKVVALHAQLTFLSRFFSIDTNTPCMVPLFGKALARFNARSNRNTSLSDDAYIKAKAAGYAYEFRRSRTVAEAFLRLYDSIDVPEDQLVLSDLSWWTRTRVDNIRKLLQAARHPDVFLSEDDERDVYGWRYDIGLTDVERLCHIMVDSRDAVIVEDGLVHNLAVDW